jgi:hypothetical protein
MTAAMPALGLDLVVTNSNDLVNGDGDGTSLREAVQTANATPGPHRITFAPSLGTIALKATLIVNRGDVAISGPAAIDLHGLIVGIGIHASGITLQRLRLLGIEQGGGGVRIIADASTPVIEKVIVDGNELRSDGTTRNPVAIAIGTTPDSLAGARVSDVRISGNVFEGFAGDGDAVLIGGSTADYLIENITIEGNAFRHCTFPIELAASAGAVGGRIRGTTILNNTFIANSQAISIGPLGDDGVGADGCLFERTVIDGNAFIDNAHGVIVQPSASAVNSRIEETTIRRNSFSGAQDLGIVIGAGGSVVSPTRANVIVDTVIEANRIRDVNNPGIHVNGGDMGTEDNAITNLQLVDNVITGCLAGLTLFTGAAHGNRLGGVRVANNTIAMNRSSGIVFTGTLQPGVDVVNNIVWNNTADFNGSPARDRFNLMVDPEFVDPANDRWSLRAGSPAIDFGTSDGAPMTDFFGQPRCGGVDAGAIEHCPSRRRRVVSP